MAEDTGDTRSKFTEEVSHKGHELKREVSLQRIRDKALRLKADLMENLETQLQDMVEDFVHEVEKIEQNGPISDGINGSAPNRKARREKGELPDKEFIARRSVLTELLEINHIRTIYHIFVAILVLFSLNTIVYDIIDSGRLTLEFDLIQWAFGKFPYVISIWLSMSLSTSLVVYPLFQFWAYNRKPGKANWQDFVALVIYIIYQIVFLVWPLRILFFHNLPPASSVIVVCEQVRFLMKSHAFVRENIPRALNYDRKDRKRPTGADETENLPCPGFSKYLYFLFAPTLVYRDSYPRTQTIRWNYVVSNFVQVGACLFYIYYIFHRFCIPVFMNFNKEHVTPKALLLSVFSSMMPGTLVLFIGFFAVLHSWLNAFAEMLRFSDRLFYKDWWNSSSFANYYRTWNIVVHDWLYSYVYRDTYKLQQKIFGEPNRPLAMATVFLLSAVFHEYILTVCFGFFYPVLFLMFAGAGFGFIFLPNKGAPRSGNVFMWVALFLGNGLLMVLYSMEWYARQNCPVYTENFFDYLMPRSWLCDFSHIAIPKSSMDAIHTEL